MWCSSLNQPRSEESGLEAPRAPPRALTRLSASARSSFLLNPLPAATIISAVLRSTAPLDLGRVSRRLTFEVRLPTASSSTSGGAPDSAW